MLVGTATVTTPAVAPFRLICATEGCDLSIADVSNTHASCTMHGEFDTAAARKYPSVNLAPDGSTGTSTDLRVNAFLAEVSSPQ